MNNKLTAYDYATKPELFKDMSQEEIDAICNTPSATPIQNKIKQAMYSALGFLGFVTVAGSEISCTKSNDPTPIGTEVVNPGNKILTGDASLVTVNTRGRMIKFEIKPYSSTSSSMSISLNNGTTVSLEKDSKTGNFIGISGEIGSGNYTYTITEKSGSETRTSIQKNLAFESIIPNDMPAQEQNWYYDRPSNGGFSMDLDSMQLSLEKFPLYVENIKNSEFHVIDRSLYGATHIDFSGIKLMNHVTGNADGGSTLISATGHGASVASRAFGIAGNNTGIAGILNGMPRGNMYFHSYYDVDGTKMLNAYCDAIQSIIDRAKSNPNRAITLSLSSYMPASKAALLLQELSKLENVMIFGSTANSEASITKQGYSDLNTDDLKKNFDIVFGGLNGLNLKQANPYTVASSKILVSVPSTSMHVVVNDKLTFIGDQQSNISYTIPTGAAIIHQIWMTQFTASYKKKQLLDAVAQGAVDIIDSSNPTLSGGYVKKGRDDGTGYGLVDGYATLKILANNTGVNLESGN